MKQLLLATIFAYIGVATGSIIRLSKLIGLAKFQDVERSNFASAIISIISSIFWLYYGIIINSTPLIFSGVESIFMDTLIICLTYYIIHKKQTTITIDF